MGRISQLYEGDGKDLRREPIEERKRLLARLLRGSNLSIVLNETFEEDGAIVYREACRLGCEGIVSKQLSSMYGRGLAALDQGQKPESSRREARSGGGLGSLRLVAETATRQSIGLRDQVASFAILVLLPDDNSARLAP
jgi:hypothetical protein